MHQLGNEGAELERRLREKRKIIEKNSSETHSVYKWQQFSLDKDYISKRARQIKKHQKTYRSSSIFYFSLKKKLNM
jgi:hypothetical protein